MIKNKLLNSLTEAMKIRFDILILMLNMCLSESSVYDWHIRTIDRGDTDFGDDLKTQTALNNERQQDILKFSGRTNDHNQLAKNVDSKSGNNINGDDVKERPQSLLYNPVSKNYEEKSDFQSILDQINNYNPAENYKQSKSSSSKEVHLARNEEDPHKMFTTYQSDILGDNIKPSVDRNEENNKTSDRSDYNKNFMTVEIESFVGTNLFESRDKKCFSSEDVALLAIRRDFEILVPKHLPDSLFDDRMVTLLMNYFYLCHQLVTTTSTLRTKYLVQKAFYDTLGGYLNFHMVPMAKYSFYAGQISLSTAKQVLILHEESKKFLNTNGNGWKAPLQNVLSQLKYVHIEPLLHVPNINDEAHGEPSSCMQLDLNTDENHPDNDKMIVQLPTIEAENSKGYLGNIWLPFRRKRTFDLKLESSSHIVAKFYEIVTKCYRFENIDQEFFNQKFKTWLMENINIHLSDDEFYPGLGAVLRIVECLKGGQQQAIGIDKDLGTMSSVEEKLNKYRSYKARHELDPKRNKIEEHHKTKERQHKLKEAINTDLKKPISESPAPKYTTDLLRTLDFSAPQIVIIAIAVTVIILIVMVCCWKFFCKRKEKKSPVELKPVKNSSSSSSNRFNSPVRFFKIRKQPASNTSTVDYSSNETGTKKSKKSVKIDKKPLIHTDTSGSSSPTKKKKSKESQGSKGKDIGKSNVQ